LIWIYNKVLENKNLGGALMEEMCESEARVKIYEALEEQPEVTEVEIRLNTSNRAGYLKLRAKVGEILGRPEDGPAYFEDKHLNLIVEIGCSNNS